MKVGCAGEHRKIFCAGKVWEEGTKQPHHELHRHRMDAISIRTKRDAIASLATSSGAGRGRSIIPATRCCILGFRISLRSSRWMSPSCRSTAKDTSDESLETWTVAKPRNSRTTSAHVSPSRITSRCSSSTPRTRTTFSSRSANASARHTGCFAPERRFRFNRLRYCDA